MTVPEITKNRKWNNNLTKKEILIIIFIESMMTILQKTVHDTTLKIQTKYKNYGSRREVPSLPVGW